MQFLLRKRTMEVIKKKGRGDTMIYQLRRKLGATSILLIVGFAISFTAVLIGISSVNSALIAMKEAGQAEPIFDTMRQTGMSLAISIYAFSVVNCIVVTNYWIITRRKNIAIKKAFGWSDIRLLNEICVEMGALILVGLVISVCILAVLMNWREDLFSLRVTPFFILGTVALLLLTLIISAIVPFEKIIKIHPAEVIS